MNKNKKNASFFSISNSIVAGSVLAIVGASGAFAGTIYDSGGFETPRFTQTYTNSNDPAIIGNLRGQDVGVLPWRESTTAGDGTGYAAGSAVVEAKPGGSGSDLQDVLVTRTTFDDRWAPFVGYTPTPSLPIVDISFDMLVNHATGGNAFGPFFGVEANDSSSGPVKQIGALGVDATTGEVLIYDTSMGIDITPSDATVAFGTYNHFMLSLNYSTDTYSVYLNNTLLDSNIGFVSSGVTSLTDADIAALQASTFSQSNQAGSAEFDNYSISSVPEPTTGALLTIGACGLLMRRRNRIASK